MKRMGEKCILRKILYVCCVWEEWEKLRKGHRTFGEFRKRM